LSTAERLTRTALECQSASLPDAALVGGTLSTRTEAAARDGNGCESPTA
jgi:hypothetical protein